MTEKLISLRAAARQIGVAASTLSRQVRAGKVRSHRGFVALDEVIADRAANLNPKYWVGRKAAAERRQASVHAPVHGPLHRQPSCNATQEGGASLVEALRRKENYAALLRELEFEVKSGRLVDREAYEQKVSELSIQDRDSWTNWPARVAPIMASELGVDSIKLAVTLEKFVREHLLEQSDPSLR